MSESRKASDLASFTAVPIEQPYADQSDRVAAERDAYAQEVFESNRHASFLAGERQRLLDDTSALRAEVDALHAEVAALRAQIAGIYASTSWRISQPIRALKQLLTRRRS